MNANDPSTVPEKRNKAKACPYLGLLTDSQTTLSFPSAQNYCHNSNPIASPNLEYQQSFCLGGRQHRLCPVFTSPVAIPLPPDVGAAGSKPLIKTGSFLPVLLGSLVVILVVIGVVWAAIYFRKTGAVIPGGTPTITPTPTPTAIFLTTITVLYGDTSGSPPTSTDTPAPPIVSTAPPQTFQTPSLAYGSPIPSQTPVACGPPSAWIRYFVQPGDSLYRLSQAYGVTVAQLQSANCLGSSTLLHNGQAIYIPPWAATPYPTPPILTFPTDTPTDIPTETLQAVPTDTPIPPASDTPSGIPTDTPGTA